MNSLAEKIESLASPFLDLMYPAVCLVCQSRESQTGSEVCQNCWDELLEIVAEPVLPGPSEPERAQKSRKIVALCNYGPPLQELIHSFKYDGFIRLGASLTDLLWAEREKRLRNMALGKDAVDFLVPTPLHIVNYKTRGFNQAEIISDILSRALDLPTEREAVAKTRLTKHQSLLSHEERQGNLSGAFAGDPEILEGKRVVLVDDVITTGATVSEVGRTVEDCGAIVVGAISLASALVRIPERESDDSDVSDDFDDSENS